MYKKLAGIVLSLSIFAATATPSQAVEAPSFPSCASPRGEVRVQYSDGTHGIVGSTSTYVGSDAVYTVTDDTILQCFCSVDGTGIQTNWWKASSLSDEQVNVLKSEGWFYVPAGNLWGLEEAPYVAKNSSYSCLPSPSQSPTPAPSSSSSSSNSSASSSSGSNGSVGGSSTGSVLGLATTGNALAIIVSFALSGVCLYFGLARLKFHAKNS